jgi:hypothetical protein
MYYADIYGVHLTIYPTNIPTTFGNLIQAIYTTTGQKVVILVDEYDKAILDTIHDISVIK